MNTESGKSFIRLLLVVGAVLLLSVIGRFFAGKGAETNAARAMEAATTHADGKAIVDGHRSTEPSASRLVRGGPEETDTEASLNSASDSGRAPETIGRLSATGSDAVAQIAGGAETELERQNRLWREGVAAAAASDSGSRTKAETRAKELFPDDPVAEILWAAGFEWGKR